MPAARYWRLVAIEAHGGADLEMSALHLYDAAGRADGTATLTSTIAPTAGTLAALQDEDLASTCRFAAAAVRASGFALVWDLGAGNSADVIGPQLAGPALATFLASCTLQCSNDGLLWQGVANFVRFDWPGAAVYTNVPGVDDPHFDKVSLLLHMGGANGSTVFTDSSPTPKTVTANGNAQISTAQSKFGGGSAHFGGIFDYLTTTNTASLEFGTGDFTVEGWIFCESFAGNRTFLCLGSYYQLGSGIIFYISNGKIAAYNASRQFIATNASVSANVWAHVAWVRSGTSFMMFTDGVLHHQGTLSANLSPTSTPIAIGFDSQFSNAAFAGYIEDLRITKGAARYTANFTPPTAPFSGALGGAGGAGGVVFLPPLLRPSTGVPPILLSGGSAGDTVMTLPPATTHLDRQDANGTETNAPATRYRIPGPRWVKEKTASTNVPLRRRVQLYNQRDSRLVREVWSDPVTGEYSFDNIRGDTTYFVIAFDHTGHYRAVIADNLTPEPIP